MHVNVIGGLMCVYSLSAIFWESLIDLQMILEIIHRDISTLLRIFFMNRYTMYVI